MILEPAFQKFASEMLFGTRRLGCCSIAQPRVFHPYFVKQVELAEAQAAHRKDPDYFVVPVFRLPISDTDARLKDALTMPISGFNGAIVDTDAGLQATRDAAHHAAELILRRLVLHPCDPLPIGLSSKRASPPEVSLDLDFIPFFSDSLPPEVEWNTDFPRALDRVKSALVDRSLTRLRLRSFAHLSLGLLFGFVFRERTGFRLDIEQATGGLEPAVWSTSEEPVAHGMSMTEQPAHLGSRNLVVKLNLVAPDHTSIAAYAGPVGAYVPRSPRRNAARIPLRHLRRPSGPDCARPGR